jgi:hypothetical protein
MSVVSFAATGTGGTPPAALTRGLYFWRLRGTFDGAVGSTTSPVWEFFVGARSTPVNTSWGTTLDVNGDGLADVAVGAPDESNETGAAYVYLAGNGGLSSVPTTLAGLGGPSGEFGLSVASAGDVNGDGFADLIVGAPNADQYAPGAAYVYLGGPGGLSTTPTALPSPGGPTGGFGYSVASAGDVNADGFADVVVGVTSGSAAYVFLGGPSGPSTTPLTLSGPPGSTAYFGRVVAGAGDVNGDGFADILVGAPALAGGPGSPGAAAYLCFGGATGVSGTPQLLTSTSGNEQPQYFALSAAGVGDVNGDGFADVIVASPDLFTSRVGPAFLYLGGSGGLSMPIALPDGYTVAAAGDVNGDGFADVVFGGLLSPGGADVYLGSADGLSQTPEMLTISGAPYAGPDLGPYTVAAAGDVNGDGFDDVLAGQPSEDSGGTYVFFGGAGGASTMHDIFLTGPGLGTGFGWSVASNSCRSGPLRYGALSRDRGAPHRRQVRKTRPRRRP